MQETNEELQTLKERAELIPKPPKGKKRYIDILLHNMNASPRLLEAPEKQTTLKSKRKSNISANKVKDLRKSKEKPAQPEIKSKVESCAVRDPVPSNT